MMKAPPLWAQNLLLDIAIEEGRDDVPDLTWGRTKKRWVGFYDPAENSILVRVNPESTRTQVKTTLLHEAAHWLTPPPAHHTKEY